MVFYAALNCTSVISRPQLPYKMYIPGFTEWLGLKSVLLKKPAASNAVHCQAIQVESHTPYN